MEEITEKKKLGLLPKIILILLFIIACFFCYMRFLEPKLITTYEYAIIDESIPDSFNGFKIAHFSDIHFGRTTNEAEVTKVVDKILEMKPDIVIFTGDLFDSYINLSEDNKTFLKNELSRIESSIGKYAISGDSDYLDIESYKEIMNDSKFIILENQNVPIFYQSETPIYLSGIPSISQGNQDYTKALTKEIEGSFYQIFLSHEPITFSSISSNTNLVLSGHSLGGLIHIPFYGSLIKKNNVGDYENGFYYKDNSTLIVSNGIGTEDISLRFLNLPSLNLYRLYNK